MSFFQKRNQQGLTNFLDSSSVSDMCENNRSTSLYNLELEISMNRVIRFTITIIAFLLALSVVGQIAKYIFGYIRPDGEDKLFVRLFDLDTENNIPSLFSVGLLFVCFILLGVIAIYKYQQRDRFRDHWKWLSFIFLGLSIDEGVSVHEELIIPLRNALGASGFLYFSWVIPAFFFVLLLGITYLKFVLALPNQIRNLLVVSGALYLSGTIGIELIGGAIASVIGQDNLYFALAADCEEILELTGILLFIYTLLKYIQLNMYSIQLRFKS